MSSNKNVLIISNYYFPEMGGAPQRITALARSFKKKGYGVRVICPLANYPEGKVFEDYRGKIKVTEYLEDIRIDRLWIIPSKSKNPILRIIGMLSFAFSLFLYLPFIKRSNLDLAIIQSPPLFVSFSAVWLVKNILRKKVCLNVSDLWPMSAVELGVINDTGKMYKVLTWLERYIYRNATVVMGQSQEIITHVSQFTDVPNFVYRNLPRDSKPLSQTEIKDSNSKTVVYAGLLGFAQGVFKICSEINFKELGIEFHIYGKGMEEDQIVKFIESNPSLPIYFHGSFIPSESNTILHKYHAALVPLANRIYGAVPSKIFELIHLQIPILYSGGGEGAELVESRGLGFSCEPASNEALSQMLGQFADCEESVLQGIRLSLLKAAKEEFDYENQFMDFLIFVDENYSEGFDQVNHN